MTDWHELKKQNLAVEMSAPTLRSTGKRFFDELLSEGDLRSFPAFLETAISEGVLLSVMQAMELVPQLESVDILASQPFGNALSASQLWHYDVNDKRIIKLFIYLEDCGPENGPFTFISAESSQRISRVLGHYVQDEQIASRVPPAQWRVIEGAAGTAFLIDTGRCYHFGSRSHLTRYAYIATYSSGLKFMRRSRMWCNLLQQRAAELSPLQRTAIGLER